LHRAGPCSQAPAEGLDWTDVAKTTVYLTKSEDFGPLNAVYAQRLGSGKPARTTVIVSALPGGALLEMDVIARTRKQRVARAIEAISLRSRAWGPNPNLPGSPTTRGVVLFERAK